MATPGTPIQEAFSGVVSPLLTGRADLNVFRTGAQQLTNMLPLPQGPITNRKGTQFIYDTEIPTGNIRFIRHQPNAREGFLLLFSDLKVDIFRASDGLLVATVVLPYLSSQMFDLRFAFSIDEIFITQEKHHHSVLTRITDTNWSFDAMPTQIDGPFLPQSTSEQEITLQVTAQDFQLQLVAAGNPFAAVVVNDYVEYLEGGQRFLGQILTKADGNNVTIRPVEFIASGLATNAIYNVDIGNNRLMADKLTFSTALQNTFIRVIDSNDSNTVKWLELGEMIGVLDGTATGWNHDQDTGAVDDEADAITVNNGPFTFAVAPANTVITVFSNTGTIFSDTPGTFTAATDVGRQIRVVVENIPVWGTITSVVSNVVVNVAFEEFVPRDPDLNTFANNGRTRDWALGALYTDNYARACAFVQQRFALGGTPTAPESFWLSRNNKFFTWSVSDRNNQVNEDSAIAQQLAGEQQNLIRWMKESRTLVVGTEGGEWIIYGASNAGGITPRTARGDQQSDNGSIIPAIKMNGIVLFYQLSGRKLREFDFTEDTERYDSTDISESAEHLLRDETFATNLEAMKEPYPIAWSTLIDGTMLSTTYIGNREIIAWANHKIGGPDAKVLDVAVARHVNATFEELWMVVERTIDGGPKRYIEKMRMEFFPQNVQDKNDMTFVDSYKIVDVPTPTAVGQLVGGFDHLIGTEVTPVVNGSVEPKQIVNAAGQIALTKVVTIGATVRVIVGYNYDSIFQSMPPEFSTNRGTAQGGIKRIHKITVKFLNTIGVSHGDDLNSLQLESFRRTSGQMNLSPDYFTDYKEFNLTQGYDRESSYFLVQTQPYPFTILQIVPEIAGTK